MPANGHHILIPAVALLFGACQAKVPETARIASLSKQKALADSEQAPATQPQVDLSRLAKGAANNLFAGVALKPDARVVVLPMCSANHGVTSLGILLSEKVAAVLVAEKRCRVADRSGAFDILVEKDLGYSDLTDATQTVNSAKLMSADYLIVGTLVTGSSRIEGALKLLDGQTGEHLSSSSLSFLRTEEMASMLTFVQRPTQGGGELPPLTIRYRFETSTGRQITDGSAVHNDEKFKILIESDSDCYAYVFLLDSQGKSSVLFPHPQIRSGNRVRGGIEYEIPPPSQPASLRWYEFDEHPGTETFVLLASYEPVSEMKEFLSNLAIADSSDARLLSGAELSYSRGMKSNVAANQTEEFAIRPWNAVSQEAGERHRDVNPSSNHVSGFASGVTSLVKRITVQHRP